MTTSANNIKPTAVQKRLMIVATRSFNDELDRTSTRKPDENILGRKSICCSRSGVIEIPEAATANTSLVVTEFLTASMIVVTDRLP
jgi:hypothetical protein